MDFQAFRRDIITKPDASRDMAEDAQAATLQIVEGVNHMGPMERADIYNRMIADFALQVQPSATMDLRQTGQSPWDRRGDRSSDEGVQRPPH